MKPANVVLVVLLSAATASVCAAQANGVPASVTSFGFGGNRNTAPGVPASVTSVGPQGFGPTSQCCPVRFFPPGTHLQPGDGTHHHHDSKNNNYGLYPGYVPIYSYGGYYAGYSPAIVAQQEESAGSDAAASDTDDEEGGPTVFEHRGARRHPVEEAYSRGYEEGRAAAEDTRSDHREEHGAKRSEQHTEKQDAKSDTKADDQPAPAVEVKTVLVYKDKHKEEIANFAIVGDSLYDFTNGRRKVALADLDVPATMKANDERGVDFQLPAVRAKK